MIKFRSECTFITNMATHKNYVLFILDLIAPSALTRFSISSGNKSCSTHVSCHGETTLSSESIRLCSALPASDGCALDYMQRSLLSQSNVATSI